MNGVAPRRRRSDRRWHRIDSGFQSLRDVGLFALGAGGFWIQITRVGAPNLGALGFCGILMAVPGVLAMWRILSGFGGGVDEKTLRSIIREEMGKGQS